LNLSPHPPDRPRRISAVPWVSFGKRSGNREHVGLVVPNSSSAGCFRGSLFEARLQKHLMVWRVVGDKFLGLFCSPCVGARLSSNFSEIQETESGLSNRHLAFLYLDSCFFIVDPGPDD